MQYYVNEAVFRLPARTFIDRTLHRLAAPLEGEEDPLNLEIRRVPMDPKRSLRSLVDEALAAEQAKENGFAVVEAKESVLDGAPALLVWARLRARDAIYLRREAHVAFEGMWLSFVVTGPGTRRVACEKTFDRLVSGLRWRRD